MTSENKDKSIGMMAVVALVISEAWIIAGYAGNLYGYTIAVGMTVWHLAFIGAVTLADLVLIPFVVKENKWAFLATMIVGIVIILVTLGVSPGYTLVTSGWQSTTDFIIAVGGGIVWLALQIQIPVIFFSFRAYRKL
jgi:hypothetical protein